jgi:hypothetical protein
MDQGKPAIDRQTNTYEKYIKDGDWDKLRDFLAIWKES